MSNQSAGHLTGDSANAVRSWHSVRREFLRLIWKEFLALRGLLTIGVASVLLVRLASWRFSWEVSAEFGMMLVSLPQLVGGVFAIGCGAALFSQEHEMRTLDFLRGMGVAPRRLLNAKLITAAVGLLFLVTLATVIRFRPPSAPELLLGDVILAAVSLGVGGVLLLWTSLWSMIVRRELLTVCCGLGGAVLLKPFLDHLSENGFLLFCGVTSIGLWLMCQAAAMRWMGSDERPRWTLPFMKSSPLDVEPTAVTSETDQQPAIAACDKITIVVGIVLLIVLSLFLGWPPSSKATVWLEWFVACWSTVVGAVLGWLPVRREVCGESSHRPTGHVRNEIGQVTLAIGWSLLWSALSMGLLGAAFRDMNSTDDFLELLGNGWEISLAWTLLAGCSTRLMARLCSARWPTWPLAVIPYGIGWSAWWLLAMTGGSAWLGWSLILALFGVASEWHRRAARQNWPIWKASSVAIGGLVGTLGLAWGGWCWWRVAEFPRDWTAGVKVTAPPELAIAHAQEVVRDRAELLRLAALISTAPIITDPKNQPNDHPCFNADWLLMDGQQSWSGVSDLTRQWVENNDEAIAAALAWQANSSARDSNTADSTPPDRGDQPALKMFWSNADIGRCRPCWILAARRCEATGDLESAWRLHRLVFRVQELSNAMPDERQYDDALVSRFWHYERLVPWIEHPAQTSLRLKSAIADVLTDGANLLPPEVMLAQKFRHERESHAARTASDLNSKGELLWERRLFRRLSLTESLREAALLDGLEAAHRVAFMELRPLSRDLSSSWRGSSENGITIAPNIPRLVGQSYLSLSGPKEGVAWVSGFATEYLAKTPRLRLLAPSHPFGAWPGAKQFLKVEELRRVTLVSMAERAFELDHGRLPNSSDELVPAYLPQPPRTIMTGRDLVSLLQSQRRAALEATDAHPAKRANRLRLSRWIAGEEPSSIGVEIPVEQPPRLILTRIRPQPNGPVGVSQ
jgi:hypothetical protein